MNDTASITVSREAHKDMVRHVLGRDPYELRNPFTGEVFWRESVSPRSTSPATCGDTSAQA